MRRSLIAFSLACTFGLSFATAAEPFRSAKKPAPSRTNPVAKKNVAQPVATESSQEALLLLADANELSGTARTIEDFTGILVLCEEAADHPLALAERRYAQELAAWAYNRRGETYAGQAADLIDQGDVRSSVKFDRLALADFEDSVRLDPRKWKSIHNRGVSYGILGRHAEATDDFTRVIEMKREYPDAWFNRAEIQLEAGRYANAVRDYTEALRLKPKDAAAYRGRGRALAKWKRPEEAIADFTSAWRYAPDDATSLVERGEVSRQLGDWESAAADFRDAIALDPENPIAYRGAAWLMATCPLPKFRSAVLAVESAERAAELAEDQDALDHSFFDTLAVAYANASRFNDAKKAGREAIRLAPERESVAVRKRTQLYSQERPYREGNIAATVPGGGSAVRQASAESELSDRAVKR